MSSDNVSIITTTTIIMYVCVYECVKGDGVEGGLSSIKK